MIINNITNYVKCWKIILTNDEVIGVTDNVTDITYNDVLYKTNFNLNKDTDNAHLGKNNNVILNIAHLLPNDIALGKLNGAMIKIFFFDYNKNCEVFEVTSGVLSKVTIIDRKFFFNIIPTIKTLNGTACKSYSRTCRASFCDKECGMSIEKFAYTGTILHVEGNKIFAKLFSRYESGYFSDATLEINNNQYKIENHNQDYVSIKLINLKENIKLNEFKIILNCDKEFVTCQNKYNNSINFRG